MKINSGMLELIDNRKVIVRKIPEKEGSGFEAYLEGARWTWNFCGVTEEEAVKNLIAYCRNEKGKEIGEQYEL